MPKSRQKQEINICKENKDIDKKIDRDILKKFSHLKELLKEIKDKEVKEDFKKDIENIKEEIESKDKLQFDLKLIEEAVAKVENTLQANRNKKDDYNALAEKASAQQRQAQDSRLENTISRLVEELPKKESNMQVSYGASNKEYGRTHLDKYESVKYGLRKEEEKRRREQEFHIVEESLQFGKYDVKNNPKDIYRDKNKR